MTGTESSLGFVSGVYASRGASLIFVGRRPGAGWHGHGYTPARPWLLRRGEPVRVLVLKRRWLHVESGRTITSQPPDLLPRRRVCTLILARLICAVLVASVGVHRFEHRLLAVRSVRQIQRDLQAAFELAVRTQQAIREALMKRCEPQPVEELWKGGLDPPKQISRRSRHPNAPVVWRALEMLHISAKTLSTSSTHLLAEARGRWTGCNDQFLI